MVIEPDPTGAGPGAPELILYARVWPRVKAILVDWAVIVGAFVVAALVGTHVQGAGAAAFVGWVAVWAFYDPIMVSLTGGTLGHHALNLRVVSDRTGGRPSFPAAFLRNVAKTALRRGLAARDGRLVAQQGAARLGRAARRCRRAIPARRARATSRGCGCSTAGPASRCALAARSRPSASASSGADGAQLGVVDIGDALRRATAAGLDLIEINRNAEPPALQDHGPPQARGGHRREGAREEPPGPP